NNVTRDGAIGTAAAFQSVAMSQGWVSLEKTASAACRSCCGMGMWETRRVSKLCASRAASPHPWARRGGSLDAGYLHVQQIGQQDGILACRAPPAHANRSAEQLARRAAALADQTLPATRTRVHGVRREDPLALELLADHHRIRDRRLLVAHPKSALFAGH